MNIDILPYRYAIGDYTVYVESTPGGVIYKVYRNGNDTPVATGGGRSRDLTTKQAIRRTQSLAGQAQ